MGAKVREWCSAIPQLCLTQNSTDSSWLHGRRSHANVDDRIAETDYRLLPRSPTHRLAVELAESLHKPCPRKLVSTECHLSLDEAKANMGGIIPAAESASAHPCMEALAMKLFSVSVLAGVYQACSGNKI